jgi:hypothetical protein
MKCSKVKELLYLYESQDLSKRLASKVGKHLTSCEICTADLRRIKACTEIAAESLKTIPTESIHDNVWQRVQAGVSSTDQPRSNAKRHVLGKSPLDFRWLGKHKLKLGLAFASVIILVTTLVLISHNSRTKHLAVSKQAIDPSSLSQYPLIEDVDNPDVKILTLQTDNPNIKVAWFFDDNFEM